MTLAGPAPGEPVALVLTADAAAVAAGDEIRVLEGTAALAEIGRIERDVGPRWIWWSKDTARLLVEAGIRPARCWDLGAVHRLLFGGWRSGPAEIWAALHDLDPGEIPQRAPEDLFSQLDPRGDPDEPVGTDGHLRPEWVDGEWAETPARLVRWAELARDLHLAQVDRLGAITDRPAARATALSESAAELLCAELEVDGLPFDRGVAETIVAGFVGPRPRTAEDAGAQLARRDHDVLQHLPPGATFDLRSPEQVKSLLRRVGIEVPDTRAWRLERLVDAHPIVAPLLAWRRAERILTTFGYDWIDTHVDGNGRLRGSWSGSDGAAGRMTATAGLHNMPAELRPAIAAEVGHAFIRSDLGQIEPRILAAVSGDPKLAAATQDDDMYAPVARQLGVEREVAKVAVLGAMYGQTTGTGAQALARLEREYPVAMQYLRDADLAAQGSHDLRTYGGRLVRMSSTNTNDVTERDARSRAAARGRYGRNAMVQGAAAEFFKTWAVLLRARSGHLGARIVLCLHDELLIHVPEANATAAADTLDAALQEAAHRWAPAGPAGAPPVRFVSDTSVILRWSEAK
ncbi:MAG: DNA polymerase I [Ilumatobacter sp.]|nr:DNA polymerase I [Ilumatobacter sp.]